MDPGSLTLGVLGVLPLISIALKTYSNVRTTFTTYRHYSRAMKRLSSKVGAEKQLFVNHTEMLVKIAVKEEDIVLAMVKNEADSRWRDQETENRIRQRLSDNYKACRDVFEEIISTLSEIESEMKLMSSDLRVRKLEGETVKDAIRRLGRSLKLPFDKSRYEQLIQDLQDNNSTLGKLLKYSRDTATIPSNMAGSFDKLWLEETHNIQEASAKLHELLQAVWNCGDSGHLSHDIKLCLDARKVSESICLDLICCPNVSSMPNCQSPRVESTRQLLVQSTYKRSETSHRANSFGSIARSTETVVLPFPTGYSSPGPTSNSHRRCHVSESSDESQKRKRLRREVHFATDCHSKTELPPSVPSPLVLHRVSPIGPTTILCSDLMHRECSTQSEFTSRCLGLFETSYQEFDFIFHSPRKCPRANSYLDMVKGKPTTIRDILLRPQDETIDPIDQIKLARRVVAGFLQFHATPWISKTWSLTDLCVFAEESSISDVDLRTLHINKNFMPRNRSQVTVAGDDALMEGLEYLAPGIIAAHNQQLEEDAFDYETYGIRNAILYRLGVALLEIGYWIDLDPKDVAGVRELANRRRGPRRIYPRYREIARRCLDCDFAYGTDLSNTSLQSAVHDKVLRELDVMIAAIDISKD